MPCYIEDPKGDHRFDNHLCGLLKHFGPERKVVVEHDVGLGLTDGKVLVDARYLWAWFRAWAPVLRPNPLPALWGAWRLAGLSNHL